MEKDLLTGVLTKAYNKTSEEIAELLYTKSADSDEVTLKEGALDLVLDLDQKRVERLKTSATPDKEKLQEIHNRALKESREDFEKQIKSTYGVESTAKGIDLVKEIIDQVSECDISDEKVKSHHLYIELEKLKSKDDYEALQNDFSDYKLNQDKVSRLTKVKDNVLTIFSGLNPIQSQNAEVAKTHRDDLLSKFEPYDYELSDDGDHKIIQNGATVEDQHGNPVKFNDFVKGKIVKSYDLAQSAARGASGNTGGGNGEVIHIDVPKTEEEYHAKIAELWGKGDREGGVKLAEAWKASQNK